MITNPSRSGPATTTLYVRNMVCDRCISTVRRELAGIGLDVRSVILGEVIVEGKAEDIPLARIREALESHGFELIGDRRGRLIEEISRAVVKLVRNDHESNPIRVKDSEFLSKQLGRSYSSLSELFSAVQNITIERYVILQRIEYAKELLKYGDLTLSEISYRLGYSSVQHLSRQFKTVTGMTPTQFKALGTPHRHAIDRVGH